MSPLSDDHWMGAALTLAARGLGRVAPNPAVGCLLVRDGRPVGRGWTQPGGRPHAEAEAIHRAGGAAAGATAYVTLEPCSHHGQTPPCADALVAAGVARAVVAMPDPDPRVAGRGLARLRDAGIEVVEGVGADAAAELNRGFLLAHGEGRPLVTLKLATTLDGRIATAAGESRWITGEAARRAGHLLRARHDAVAVGAGTALADDPDLTCRLPGFETGRIAQPLRVVFDTRGRLGPDARLCDGTAPTLVLTGPDAGGDSGKAERAAVDAGADGRLDPRAALAVLARRGITRLMVEGGGALAAALVRAGLVDRIAWFRAGTVLGADARPGLGELGLAALADAPRYALRETRTLGPDTLERWARA